MSELTTKDVRDNLMRYLAGDLDARAFRDWFALVLRDAHKASDPEVEELAHAIEWTFCDAEREGWNNELLKARFVNLLDGQPTQTEGTAEPVRYVFVDTDSQTVNLPFGVPTGSSFPPVSYGVLSSSGHSPRLEDAVAIA